MERSTPTFLSREQLQDSQFYKDWLRTALLGRLPEVDQLLRIKQRVALTPQDKEFFRSKGIDPQPFTAAEAMIDAQIKEEIDGAVHDLRATIFEKKLFRVGIQIDDDPVAIDDITAEGTVILPVIGDEVYSGPFTDVIFDR